MPMRTTKRMSRARHAQSKQTVMCCDGVDTYTDGMWSYEQDTLLTILLALQPARAQQRPLTLPLYRYWQHAAARPVLRG
jgi:hypothetical protein